MENEGACKCRTVHADTGVYADTEAYADAAMCMQGCMRVQGMVVLLSPKSRNFCLNASTCSTAHKASIFRSLLRKLYWIVTGGLWSCTSELSLEEVILRPMEVRAGPGRGLGLGQG